MRDKLAGPKILARGHHKTRVGWAGGLAGGLLVTPGMEHLNRRAMAGVGAGTTWIAAALGTLAACATRPPPEPPQQAQLTRAVAPPAQAKPSQELPGVARAVLKTRMALHARDMSELVSAIMILDYPRIHERARAITSDVSLSRPLTADATELASLLPESFFVFQDELRARATALATAASARDAFAVADTYGRVSETCVRCHAAFRPRTPDAPG